MANEFKVKKGLIVHGSGSTILDVRGSQGQLFSVTDSLSGSLFGISDISGVPIFEVFSDETIRLGTSGSEAILITGSHATVSGSFSGSFVGDGSGITGLASGGSVTAINNATANELVTIGATTTELDAEANLTFDGTQLNVTGNVTASGHIKTGQYLYLGHPTGATVNLFNDDNILRTDDVFHANANIHVGGDGKIFDRAGTNSFIHFDHANSKIRIQEGGEEMVTIDSGTVTINQAQGQNKFKVFASSSSAHFFVSSSGMTIINNDTTDYFGAATRVQIFGGSASQNVGIRSNILYLYTYSNGSTSQLVFGDGGANWGLFANDTTFKLYDYSISGPGLTVSAGSNLFAFNSGSKNVYIGQNLADTAAEGKLKIYNRSNDGIISTYQYNSTLELRSGVSASNYVDNWSRILLKDNNSGAGNIAFWVSGSESMRITNAGKVGIGTTTPADTLVVRALSSSTAGTTMSIDSDFGESKKVLSFTHNGTTPAAKIYGYGRATSSPSVLPYFAIEVNNSISGSSSTSVTERLRILSTGLVGIGTTSPGTNLEIFSGSAASLRVKSDGQASIIIDSDADNSGTAGAYLHYRDTGATKWTLYKETNNDFYLFNGAASTYPIHAKAGGDIVLMEDGNNLGIGPGTPASKLDVSGSIRVHQTTAAKYVEIFGGNSGNFIDSYANDLYIRYGGNTSTSIKLDSSGNTTFTGILRTQTSGSAASPAYSFVGATDTGMYKSLYSGTNDQINFTIDGSNRAQINSAGITSAANVYTGTSGQFRNYAGVWKATTGTSGNGFNFSSADLTDAVTISADANNQLTVSGSGANTGIVIVGGSNAMVTRLRAGNSTFHLDVDQGQQGGKSFSLNLSGSNKINLGSSRTVHYNILNQRGNLDGAPPDIQFDRNDASIVAGNGLGSIKARGKDPSSYNDGAGIIFQGDGSWDTDDYPTRILFKTDQAGTLTTALTIDSDQSSSFTGNVTVTGDLTVTGTTTTVNSQNLDLSDNIIGLNRGAPSNANDSGLIIERGSTGDNAAFLWDESADTFIFGTTGATASDTGNIAYNPAAFGGKGFWTSTSAISHWGSGINGTAYGILTWSTGYASVYGTAGNVLKLGSHNTQGIITISSSISTFSGNIVGQGDILVNTDVGSYIELDKSDGSLKFADNNKLKIGTGNDFSIGHASDVTSITNHLSGGDIRFYSGSTEFFRIDGGTSKTEVFEDLRLLDNVNLLLGSNVDLQLYHTGTTGYIRNNTGNLEIRNQTSAASDLIFKTTTANGLETFLTLSGSEFILAGKSVAIPNRLSVGVTSVNGSYGFYNQGTFYTNGNATVNANLVVDSGSVSISQDGSNAATLTADTDGDFTIAAVDDLRLQAGGEDIVLKGSSGTEFGRLTNSSGHTILRNVTNDKNITIKFKTGGTEYNGLIISASQNGTAYFNRNVHAGSGYSMFASAFYDSSNSAYLLDPASTGTSLNVAGNILLADDKNIDFGAGPDFRLVHNSSTNVNHVSSKLDRQLSLNANIIRFTNQANDATAASISGSKVGIGILSPTASLHVSGTNNVAKIEGSGSTIFSIDGSQGQLFSVTDQLSGSLFNVSDISGVPILQVDSADRVTMGTYASNALVVTGSKVGIGTASPGYPLSTAGTIRAEGMSSSPGSGVGLELRYDTSGNYGSVLSYDRANSAYKELRLEGSVINLREAGTNILTIDGGNATFAGLISAGAGINVTGNIDTPELSINDYIKHNGNTNTYFGFSGADTYTLVTGGTTALTVSSAQNATFAGEITSGRLNITDNGVPIKFTESGNTGTGKYWRQVLDAGDIRFDVDTTSTNGNGSFSSYNALIQLNADGHTDINGNLDVGGGIDVTGVINTTGNATIGGYVKSNAGNLHLSSSGVVMSTSASANNLVIGDVTEGDVINDMRLKTQAGTNILMQDDLTDIKSSTVKLTGGSLPTSTITGFIGLNNNNVIQKRTAAQMRSDIGAQVSGNFVTDAGGAVGQVGVWSSGTAMSGSNNFFYNEDNGRVGLGGITDPSTTLHVVGNTLISGSGTQLLRIESADNSLGDTLAEFKHQDGTNNPRLTIDSTSSGMKLATGFTTGINGSFDLQSNGGSSYIALSTNGANERMRVTSAGKVGIGTVSPTAYVEVDSGGVDNVLRLIGATNGKPHLSIYTGNQETTKLMAVGIDTTLSSVQATGSIKFLQSTTERMRIHSDGNVGIGTNSPGAKLDVNSTAIWVNPPDGSHAGLHFRQAGTFKGFVGYNDSADIVNLSMDGSIVNGINVNSSHNVGIGTTTPDERLEVMSDGASGSLKVTRASNVDQALYLRGGAGSGEGWVASQYFLELRAGLGGNTTYDVTLTTAAGEGLRVDASKANAVGIGTTAPRVTAGTQAKLDVEGLTYSQIRRKPNAYSNSTVAAGQADYYAKFATIDISGANHNDITISYTVDVEETSAIGFARFVVRLRKGTDSTNLSVCDLTILEMHHAPQSYGNHTAATTTSNMFGEDSFVLKVEGDNDIQLWIQKKTSYGVINLYEDSVNYEDQNTSTENAVIDYITNATWQTSVGGDGDGGNLVTYLAATRQMKDFVFFTNTTSLRYLSTITSFLSGTENYSQKLIVPKPGVVIGMSIQCSTSMNGCVLELFDADDPDNYTQIGSDKIFNVTANRNTWVPFGDRLEMNGTVGNRNAIAVGIKASSSTTSYWNAALIIQY